MIIHGNSTKFCSNILQNHVRNIWQDISTDFKNVAQVQIWRKILAIFKSDRFGATHPAPVKCKHVKHIRVTIIRSKNINRLRNFDLLECDQALSKSWHCQNWLPTSSPMLEVSNLQSHMILLDHFGPVVSGTSTLDHHAPQRTI